MKITILMTPGLDSYITYNKFLFDKLFVCNKLNISSLDDCEIKFVYFNLHTRYSNIEMKYINTYYNDNKFKIDIVDVMNMETVEDIDAHVPNRNILLVTMAQSIYNSDIIIINGVKDDRVSDNNKSIFEKYSEILSITAEKPVQIKSLLWDKEKYDLLFNLNYVHFPDTNTDMIKSTFSCYYPHPKPQPILITTFYSNGEIKDHYSTTTFECRRCPACYRKSCAISALNIYIPIVHEFAIIDNSVKLLYEIPDEYKHRRFSINKYYNMYKKIKAEKEVLEGK